MKRLFLVGAVIALTGSLGWADTEATPPSAKMGPCKDIIAACNAAGYVRGGHKSGPNKGEWIDCADPILKGQPAPTGVTVDPAVVSACLANRAKHPGHKHPMAGSAPASGAAPATSAPAAAQ